MPRKPDYTKGRSLHQKNRILAALKASPASAQELADKLHLTRDAINIHLQAMKRLRLVHVSGYYPNPKGGRRCCVYSCGKGQDAEFVKSRTPTRHLIVGQVKDEIVALLADKMLTTRQISLAIGKSEAWTRQIVYELRQDKRLHIGGHVRQKAGPCPLYAAGDKPDVPREGVGSTESGRRARARKPLWIAALMMQSIMPPAQYAGTVRIVRYE